MTRGDRGRQSDKLPVHPLEGHQGREGDKVPIEADADEGLGLKVGAREASREGSTSRLGFPAWRT